MLAIDGTKIKASASKHKAMGYFSEANVTAESVKDVDLYVATGCDKHGR